MKGQVALALIIVAVGWASPAHAETITVTCPDQTPVQVEFTTDEDAFNANIARACAGHEGSPSETGSDAESVSTGPAGQWEWAGYVCDNGGICNSVLLCSDGTPKMLYVFVHPDGTRDDPVSHCPGDPDIPAEPPSRGQINEAFRKVKPPVPALSIQPPGGRTLVNFKTIFSTEAKEFSSGQMKFLEKHTIEFLVSPVAFTWHFDEGTVETTDWQGEPWSKDVNVDELITHIYTSTEDVHPFVTVTWGAKASLDKGPWIPLDATVDTTSEQVDLDILEAVPQLVAR